MTRGIRKTAVLLGSMALLSTISLAQASGNNSGKQSDPHHSRLSKMAFWHRNKNSDKKPAQSAKPAAKPAQASKAQTSKKEDPKSTPVKATADKQTSKTKQITASKTQKPQQHASKTSNSATKKQTASKAKSQAQAKDSKEPKTVALKQ